MHLRLCIAQTSETPLWAANNRGHVEVVKALIEAGADVNLADEVNDGIAFKAWCLLYWLNEVLECWAWDFLQCRTYTSLIRHSYDVST